MFRRTRLASFQLNRKDVASISSRVLRESFKKLGREQKEEFGEGVERKEGGACFKESKVNFTNVDMRRFTNKPHREIYIYLYIFFLGGGAFCGIVGFFRKAFPLLPSPLLLLLLSLFFCNGGYSFERITVTGEFSSLAMGECALPLRSINIVDKKIFKMAAKVARGAHTTWANTYQDRPKRRLMQGQRKYLPSCKLGSQAFQHGGLFVVMLVNLCFID